MTSQVISSMTPVTLEATTDDFLNQSSNGSLTSAVTSSITPMTIAAVSVVMVISSLAVVMNSGILLMTYRLQLISKDYRMIYYVLITATDLTFSVHSIINCITIILRGVKFFKYKWFCLILQCSGTVSYQISAMSIILLIFDLFVSIRNPFSTETSKRRKLSYLATFIAIFVAVSLAYGPFIWWYGSESTLDFCSIANVYGSFFNDYHKMATSVLAVLFLLMIITSSLLLKEISSSIQPRRRRTLKVPSILKHDFETISVERLASGRRNALGYANNRSNTEIDQQNETTTESTLPDVVSGVEKVTMSLSNYVGIDNKTFNKEERMTIRNRLLNIAPKENVETPREQGCPFTDFNSEVDSDRMDYTDAVSGTELGSRKILHTNYTSKAEKYDTESSVSDVNGIPGYVNQAFDDMEEKRILREGGKEKDLMENIEPKKSVKDGQTSAVKDDTQRLSVDAATAYRGSVDKVRRLTGTETVGQEIKQIASMRSEKRKHFIQACKTVAAFMTAFLGCGLPYYILSVVELSQGMEAEDSSERRTVRMICALFLYLLPIVDPILYTSRFQIIKQTLGKYLPKGCKRGQQD